MYRARILDSRRACILYDINNTCWTVDSLTLSFIVQMQNFSEFDVARSSYGLIMAAAARKNIVTSESENSYSSKLKFILIGVHVANQFQVYDLICN